MLNSSAVAHSSADTSFRPNRTANRGMLRDFIRRATALLLTTVSLGACGAVANTATKPGVLELALEGGGSVKQFVSDSTLSIVMVFASSECLSCSNDLNRWVEIARDHRGRATLILTSTPAAEVRDALVRLRIPYASVRKLDEQRALELAPAVIVFRRGVPLMTESRIAPNRRALLVDSGRRILLDDGEPAR